MDSLHLERIRAAFRECEKHHNPADGPFIPFRPISGTQNRLEQIHHGTTAYALAAWHQWRDMFRGQVHSVRGDPGYLIPDRDGNRTIANPAVIVERLDGLQLALTGCTWGYGGEGPHGTAAVLVDVGLFDSIPDAMVRVAAFELCGSWELSGVPEPSPVPIVAGGHDANSKQDA